MADYGATRRVARANLQEATGIRGIYAFIGDVYLRDDFNSLGSGVSLNGRTPQAGIGNWIATNLVGDGAGRIRHSNIALAGNGNARVDAGVAEGAISAYIVPSTTPLSGADCWLYMRLPATPTFSGTGANLAGMIANAGLSLAISISNTPAITLYRDGTSIGGANFTLTAGAPLAVEMIVKGDEVQVWIDRALILSGALTDPVVAADTYVGIGISGAGVGASDSFIQEVYFTEVPSCPGAADTDQANHLINPIAVLAGSAFDVHVRWGLIGTVTTGVLDAGSVAMLDFESAPLRSQALVAPTGDYGFQSFEFCATTTGDSSGDAQAANGRLRIRASRGSTTWAMDSENVVVTAPAGTTHNHGRGYFTAEDPDYVIVMGAGPTNDPRHFVPGQDLLVGLAGFDLRTDQMLTLDVGTAEVVIARLNLGTMQAEYLDSDLTWKAATNDLDVYAWPCTETFPGSKVWIKQFTGVQTANWGAADLFIIGQASVQNYNIANFMKEIVVTGENNHGDYEIDPVAYAESGKISYK